MSDWKWFACGKHPLANDFFQIGQDSPLGLGFYRWVQAGYEKTVLKYGPSQIFHSWRFWAKGNDRNELILGLLKDSSDQQGRQFPLLILGLGNLKGWTSSWPYLPIACENVWQAMEHLSATRLSIFNEFEQQLNSIRPPENLVLKASQQAGNLQNPQEKTPKSSSAHRIQLKSEDDPRTMMAFQISNNFEEKNWLNSLTNIHHQIQDTLKGYMPQIVFMGGASDKMLVLSFFRSLTASDFVWMWSISKLDN